MPESLKSRELSSREQKRRRILRAAIDVFATKGYFAARMTDIAEAAQVADGTLYLYFEGKEHLLMSIFDDVLGRFILAVPAIRDRATPVVRQDPRADVPHLDHNHIRWFRRRTQGGHDLQHLPADGRTLDSQRVAQHGTVVSQPVR